MRYHGLKMADINKIIKEYWINTYKGNGKVAYSRLAYQYEVTQILKGIAFITGQSLLICLIVQSISINGCLFIVIMMRLSPVLRCFSGSFQPCLGNFPLLRGTALSAGCERSQGWLTTVLFQKSQANLT